MGGGVLRAATKAAAFGAYCPALGRATSAGGVRSTVPSLHPSASSTVVDSTPISIHLEESNGWKSDVEDMFEYLPPSRLVFSPVPTIKEAMEATGDLTCMLKRANEHGQMGIFQNNAIRPAMQSDAAQAFSLLQNSTEAQSVVASLVSDPNVWNAVEKNEKLIEYCRNHQSSFYEDTFGESLNTNKSEEIHSEAGEAPDGSNGISKFLNNVKVKAMKVVNNISNLIPDNGKVKAMKVVNNISNLIPDNGKVKAMEVVNNISNLIPDNGKVKAMEFVNNIANLIQDFFETKDGADSSEARSTFQSFKTPKNFYVLTIAVIIVVLVKRA